jgi:vacuolar-type H+-ATPase subunit H
LEEVNRELFSVHGLKVEILPTYAMVQVLGCPADSSKHEQFETAGLGENATLQQQEQTQIDRMRALDGRVMQLTYHILAQSPATSNSWAQNQAAKKAAKQHEEQSEDLVKAHEKRNEKMREATSHHDKDMAEYTHDLHKLQEKLQDDLRKDASSPGKQEKARRKYEEKVRELYKDKGQGKFRGEMRETDDEVLELRTDEGKEVKYLEWVVTKALRGVKMGGSGSVCLLCF